MSLAAAAVRLTVPPASPLRVAALHASRAMSSSSPSSSSASSSATTTSKHYQNHTSSSYESAYFYSQGEYTSCLAGLVRDALVIPQPPAEDGREDSPPSAVAASAAVEKGDDPKEETKLWKRRIIDIGGGTGNFTRMLVDHPNSGAEAVVVDPFLERSSSSSSGEEANDAAVIEFVKASAEDFASADDNNSGEWWRSNYHQVLLKEVVHHIADGDRAAVFRGMREGTSSDIIPLSAALHPPIPTPPSILIVTRPQTEIDYPLWPEARSVWAANQPSSDDIESDLREAGYVDVRRVLYPYPCEIELERWLTMVRNRFWSTFSNFTDDELDEACERIGEERKAEAEADKRGRIRFEDRLVFITGRK